MMNKIYNFSFWPIDSRMYIIMEGKKAFIVDPCEDEKALELLKINNIDEILIVLTHEHYDHISGVNWLRMQFKNICVLCSEKCGQAIGDSRKNLSDFGEILYMNLEGDFVPGPYICQADKIFEDEYKFDWQGHKVILKETPGHSPGSICIFFDDILFSGDTLVNGKETITRLPGGKKKEFKEITLKLLGKLDREMMVYPGHGQEQKLKDYIEIQRLDYERI